MPYLMAVDIGNSDISIGIFKLEDARPSIQWRIETRTRRTKDEYGLLLESALRHYGLDVKSICHVVVSCVVPLALKPLVDSCTAYLGVAPLVIEHGVKTGVQIQYGGKGDLSTDRVANMAAAVTQFPAGAIVLDCGTLINLDVVDKNGVYKGGNILLGPLLMHQKLVDAIPRIPEVHRSRPEQALGRDLMSSVQNGAYYAVAGALKLMLERLSAELPNRLPVIGTGGFATELANDVPFDHIEPDLTLMGLKQIYDKNRQPDEAAKCKKENG